MFLGRRFRLESSSLRFAGGSKIDPILDIRAVYQGPELRVMANLTGPISNPGLNLSSDPTVPEDEILARALFNKSAGELSAVEAVQLAAAVGELTATGGGPGALARLREAVGVDVLRFGTTETTEGEQATTVEAGRYLAEGLYLGVETSTFEESGAVTVEYEVTKKIRLTTDLKQTGGKNIGVEYKRDY
jgi:translocation and assembly module TamB